MEVVMNWVSAHHEVLFSIATALVTVASLVASLTPTPKDDTVVGKLYKIVDFLAINVGKAKDTGIVDPTVKPAKKKKRPSKKK